MWNKVRAPYKQAASEPCFTTNPNLGAGNCLQIFDQGPLICETPNSKPKPLAISFYADAEIPTPAIYLGNAIYLLFDFKPNGWFHQFRCEPVITETIACVG